MSSWASLLGIKHVSLIIKHLDIRLNHIWHHWSWSNRESSQIVQARVTCHISRIEYVNRDLVISDVRAAWPRYNLTAPNRLSHRECHLGACHVQRNLLPCGYHKPHLLAKHPVTSSSVLLIEPLFHSPLALPKQKKGYNREEPPAILTGGSTKGWMPTSFLPHPPPLFPHLGVEQKQPWDILPLVPFSSSISRIR